MATKRRGATRSAPPRKYTKKKEDPKSTGKAMSYQDILDSQPVIERPKEDITAENVEKLASLGCTYEDIADFFNVHPSFIIQYYKEPVLRGRSNLKMSLRMTLVNSALRGNVPALLFLSKNFLNMSDKMELEVTRPEDHKEAELSDDELLYALKHNNETTQ